MNNVFAPRAPSATGSCCPPSTPSGQLASNRCGCRYRAEAASGDSDMVPRPRRRVQRVAQGIPRC